MKPDDESEPTDLEQLLEKSRALKAGAERLLLLAQRLDQRIERERQAAAAPAGGANHADPPARQEAEE